MTPRASQRGLWRIALSPDLLFWSLGQSLALPFRRLGVAFKRRRRRNVDPRWAVIDAPSQTYDPATTAATLARPGPHVVMTGIGYGEFVMISRVAEALREKRPDANVSVALRDEQAIAHVRTHHPELNVSWCPHGLVAVSRWLATQRPDVVTLIEGYRYPALVVGSSRYGARVMLLNGRCKDRKSFHHPLFGLPFRWLFRGYAAIAMQRGDYADAVRDLLAPSCDLQVCGDVKTDYRPPALSSAQCESLTEWLSGELPLVAAGSTDNLEEERMVLAAFRRTREAIPCRLLLAPRHPSLLGDLRDLLAREGLTVSRRSQGVREGADVLLLDTQGELANAYVACAAAYVGGSYSPRGLGHNPIEPLAAGVPVAYGLQRGHFDLIQTQVEEAGVGTRIADDGELAGFWLSLLRDPEEGKRIGRLGKELVESSRGAIERTVSMILPLLPPAEKGDR